MKKVAYVTGSNGFVGSHLVEYLLEKDMEVHCLMRASSNDKWLRGLDVTIHRGGIEDVEFLKKTFAERKPNYIFHLAGTVNAKDYAGYERGNVFPTKVILIACLDFADSIEKIMITSSLAASAPTTAGNPVDENQPRQPVSEYGMSKVVEEDLAYEYMDRLPITIVRPPVVYGERDTEVLLFFKTVKNHLVPLIGFNNKTLSLVYVKDLIAGMYLSATIPKSSGQTYFLGGYKDEYTWKDIGSTAAKILGVKAVTLRVPHFVVFSVAYVMQTVASIGDSIATLNVKKADEMTRESWSCTSAKARADLGYDPKVDIQEGFTSTIKWYRDQKWL